MHSARLSYLRPVALTLLAILISGCSGAGVPSSDPTGAAMLGHRHSWMSRASASTALLYISDNSTYEVYVYSYPDLVLVGTLTGFTDPGGLCVDKAGDVFVTSSTFYSTGYIYEYAHGGTEPIATLNDPNGYPESCSVDRRSGALAVTNLTSASGPGNVSIYAKAQGTPTMYSNGNFYKYFYCAYDLNGNLYVDGRGGSGAFQFAELAKRSATLATVSLNQSIEYPGGVLWDGQYIAVGDQQTNTVYRFSFSGSSGTSVGSSQLLDSAGIQQFFIKGKRFIGTDPNASNVGIWAYPAGGNVKKTIAAGLSNPVGVVISK